jgi:hypothetical protein
LEGQIPLVIPAESESSLTIKVVPKDIPNHSVSDYSKVQAHATMFFDSNDSGLFETTFWIEGSVIPNK